MGHKGVLRVSKDEWRMGEGRREDRKEGKGAIGEEVNQKVNCPYLRPVGQAID